MTRRFTALNATALLVGVVAGLAAIGFRLAISFVENLAFKGEIAASAHESGEFLVSTWGLWVFLVPTAGGALIGLIKWRFPAVQRQGISEVMAAVQARGGIIKGRTAWGHALLSAITVGTGGSTGREGPIGYIGGAMGSSIARRLGFRSRDIKVLLGAGTAAGIAATFNAPLGGVLFAMELILPEFSTHAFIPVVAAVVIGVTVSTFFLGDSPTFLVPEFTLVSPWELLVYLFLGVAAGFGGVLFIRIMQWASDAGDRTRLPDVVKPAVGGLAVGVLGLAIFLAVGNYHIYGTGYATVNAILGGDGTVIWVPLLLLLMFAKPLASSITIASGGGGGVFSASLYQGALYGALFGLLAQFMPFATAPVSAYALVGMGAFYAATGRATLTTIVLMSELTEGYAIVLPLMFAAVAADAVSVGMIRDSIYTVRLRKSGIRFEHDRMQSPLDTVTVGEVMCSDIDSLQSDLTVGRAWDQMLDMGHSGFPVLDQDGALVGVVTRSDLARCLSEGRADQPLGEVVSGLLITAFPEEPLYRARDRLHEEDVGRLIVVDPTDRRRCLGIITRTDLLHAEAEHDVEHGGSWGPGHR